MRAVIADDDRTTTAILSKALTQSGIDVAVADDGMAAWQLLNAPAAPSLAIVDWMMPGLDGIELCRRVRRSPSLAGLYMILLTGRNSRSDMITGLDAGADDYMTKPVDADELRARVQVGRRVLGLHRRLAEQVSELQSARDHLARLVSTDVLTNVYSRRWWFEQTSTELSRCIRYGRTFSLLAIDLDFFKQVNDRFGHEGGDRLLQQFADMLRRECRQSDIIGRLGGEEFAVLVPETTLADAKHVAARIVAACRELTLGTGVSSGTAASSCSIGISQLRDDDMTVESVLRRADRALYCAKKRGRDRWICSDAIDDGACGELI